MKHINLVPILVAVFSAPNVDGFSSKQERNQAFLDETLVSHDDSTAKSVTCGGSFTNASGRIEYKQFEAVGKSERCVWILQPAGYTSATVELYPNNPPPQAGSLLVTGIANYVNDTGLLLDSVTPTVSSTLIRNANMLIVTFTTTTAPSGSGFTLIYSFGKSGDIEASPNSLNILADSDLGYIRHPALQSAVYAPQDLSVFIVLPAPTCTLTNKIRLRYSEIELEGGNYDSLFLYEFKRPTWSFRGRIVSGVESQLVTSQDILMVVFVSDGVNEFQGFELVYAVC